MADRATIPSQEIEPGFRLLAELAPIGLFQTDAAGNCLFVNDRWCEIAGMEPGAALGQGWSNALHPEDHDWVLAEWLAAAENGSEFKCECRFRTSSGRTTWIHGVASAIRNDANEITGYIGTVTDISKRKAAEQALAAKEAQLRLVTDHVPVLIANCDRERRFKFVNRSYATRLGLMPEAIVGRTVSDVIGDEAYQSFAIYVERVLAGEALEFELDIPYAKLGPRVMQCSYVPEFDAQGGVVGWVAALSDVTDRRKAEDTLFEMRERFSRFMQHLPGLAWIKDEHGRYVFANEAAISAFQTTRDSLYGRTDAEVFSPQTAARFRENDEQAVTNASGWLQTIERLKHGDGQIHHSIVNKFAIPGPDGATPMVGGIAIDVTDRLRMADQLLRNEQRLNLAQRAGRIGTFDWNVRTNEVEWSATEEELFGLPVGGFGGTFDHWKQMLHPADAADAIAACERAVREGTDLSLEFRIVRPTGEIRWIAAQAQLLRDEKGQPTHMIGVNVDITEQKDTEAALRAADRRKDEFLATLAHELRNPLAPLRNSLHILRMTGEDTATKPLHEIMERQVNHMVRLIDDLLEISRITRGTINLRPERVELAAIVRNALDTSRPLIQDARHQLEVNLPSFPVVVDVDGVRIAQVIANLLNNAARYTEAGGRITLDASVSYDRAVVSVRDNGIGIEPNMLARIFEMFAQADHDHKRAQGGLGIGLALSKALVEMHGGSIQARSDGLGQGSEFTLWIPLAHGAAQADGEQSQAPRIATRHILVVDDNHDAAVSLAMLLRKLGNDVQVATSGATALELLDTFHPAIIFLDLGMPGMSGYEVAAHIQQRSDAGSIRLIALTGWGQQEDRKRTSEAGFHQHLVKPVDLAALGAILAE